MLNEFNLPKYFWVDVIIIACYVMKEVLIILIQKHMPYEYIKEGREIFLASMFFVSSISSLTTGRVTLVNLMLNLTMLFFLDIPILVKISYL